MKTAAVLVTVSSMAALMSAQHAPTLQSELRGILDRRLAGVVESLDGVVGYAALDLTSGEEIGRLEQEAFPTASTIKLAVLYELFRQADEGRLPLDTPAPLDRRAVVGGDGILKAMGTPALTLRDHAVLMMALSDNTATNVLIDQVGLQAVTSRMQALGLSGIRLRRKMMDGEAAKRGDENVATPRDLVRLLRILYTGERLAPDSRAAALRVLEAGNPGWLRRAVPAEVVVVNKPGTLEGVRVDAGIVRLEKRPYALAVMTTYLGNEAEGERAIVDVSRAFYEYYSRFGAGSAYGRQIGR